MKPFIIGTAGHVDHGKTSLVRFLTGVNTDRLQEEQERGITIELGFAPLEIVRGKETLFAGIVDVPGHERFVRHMVSGAGGVDLVMMVIAADEGVRPQTREHLDICRLLEVDTGIVILTKVDLVDADWIDLAEEEVREALRGTFLEGAPVVRFSVNAPDPAAQRRTVEDAIWQARTRVQPRDDDALFRMPVDRVFSLKGHGTVVTGTVIGGRMAEGEELALPPTAVRTRLRSIQSFGRDLKEIAAGMRAALNLPGIETAELGRGLVVTRPGSIEPTDAIDAVLQHLPHAPRPLDDRTAVIFHVGATHTNATMRVFEDQPLAPGETGVVRLHLEEPVVTLPGDRFIVRGYEDIAGHGKTVGGGVVLNLAGGPYRVHFKGPRLREHLKALAAADAPGRVRLHLQAAGHGGLSAAELAARTAIGPKRLQALLDTLGAAGKVHPVDDQPRAWLDEDVVRALADRVHELVREHGKANPLADGIGREEIRSQVKPSVTARALAVVLERLARDKRVVVGRDVVALPGKGVLSDEDAALAERVDASIRGGGLAPPRVEQLAEETGAPLDRVRGVVTLLARRGKLVRVAEGLFYAPEPLAEARTRLVAYLQEHSEITTQTFKDMTGLSRRWLIPLAEYFDQEKVTLRKGEVRILRR